MVIWPQHEARLNITVVRMYKSVHLIAAGRHKHLEKLGSRCSLKS